MKIAPKTDAARSAEHVVLQGKEKLLDCDCWPGESGDDSYDSQARTSAIAAACCRRTPHRRALTFITRADLC